MVCLSYSISSCFFEDHYCLFFFFLGNGFQFSQGTNLENMKVALASA